MLQSVPPRALAKPRLIGSFECLTPIIVQVVGPLTLYIAETDVALLSSDDSGLIDALQINQATGPYLIWAKGDIWAAGSQVAGVTFKPLIYIPGNTSGSGLKQGDSI